MNRKEIEKLILSPTSIYILKHALARKTFTVRSLVLKLDNDVKTKIYEIINTFSIVGILQKEKVGVYKLPDNPELHRALELFLSAYDNLINTLTSMCKINSDRRRVARLPKSV